MNRRFFLEQLIGAGASLVLAKKGIIEPEKKKIIMLDPGHGMGNRKEGLYDPGAVRGDVEEAKIVIDQAQRVGEILKDGGYDVCYTREDDIVNAPLEKRAVMANERGADIFVSLHCNSADNAAAQGVRLYHYPEKDKGKELAREVYDSLVKTLVAGVPEFENPGKRWIGAQDFRVLRETKMPAVLVESGFLSNDRDIKYLTEKASVVAKGIAEGIKAYLNGN